MPPLRDPDLHFSNKDIQEFDVPQLLLLTTNIPKILTVKPSYTKFERFYLDKPVEVVTGYVITLTAPSDLIVEQSGYLLFAASDYRREVAKSKSN